MGLSEDLDLLRRWRENNERKSREIIDMWNARLQYSVEKFGKELHIVLEQVCIAAFDSFQIEIAHKCVKRLYKEFPRSLRVRKLEAMCYEVDENYEKALKILDEIIKEDDTNSSARKRKIAILKAQCKVPEAIKELTEYLKIFMADVEAWQELGELYINEQDFNRAAFCTEELILHNPHNHLLYQRLADIRYSQGGTENLEQARAYYCQAAKLNPKNIRALYGLYLVSTTLGSSIKCLPQKKKDNAKLASWAQDQIKLLYEQAKVENIESRLSAIQL